MGGEYFTISGQGATPEEAYTKLVKRMIAEYGDNPYNGTISTCSLGYCRKEFEGKANRNRDKAINLVDGTLKEGAEKWRADYVKVGVCGYEEYSLEVKKVHSIRNMHGYRVVDKDFVPAPESDLFYKETDGIKNFKEIIKRNINTMPLDAEYKLVLCGIPIYEAKWEVKRKSERVLKRTLKESNRIIPIYEYMFYGIAGC